MRCPPRVEVLSANRLHHVASCDPLPIARPPADSTTDLAEDEQRALAAMAQHRRWGTGYSKQQSTRPQTLGYGLVDSPVGQLAWIVEKFWAWMDCDGHPENVLSRAALRRVRAADALRRRLLRFFTPR